MTSQRLREFSPQMLARIGGAIYVMIIVSGLLGEAFIRGPLIAPGDAATTLANIRSATDLWRFSIAANLFHLVCSLPLAVVFYVLLSPVSRQWALLALILNIAAIVLEAGSKLFLFPPLFVLSNATYLQVFSPDQLATLAYVSQRMHSYGFTISLTFFGFECLVLGYLIHQSSFIPKAIGWMMVLAGTCYVVNCFLTVLSPTLSNMLILVPSFFGELSLALWLLIRGVDASKWHGVQSRCRGEPILEGSTAG